LKLKKQHLNLTKILEIENPQDWLEKIKRSKIRQKFQRSSEKSTHTQGVASVHGRLFEF